jgi:hypothetical protein
MIAGNTFSTCVVVGDQEISPLVVTTTWKQQDSTSPDPPFAWDCRLEGPRTALCAARVSVAGEVER